jgi:hypothetical protein
MFFHGFVTFDIRSQIKKIKKDIYLRSNINFSGGSKISEICNGVNPHFIPHPTGMFGDPSGSVLLS